MYVLRAASLHSECYTHSLILAVTCNAHTGTKQQFKLTKGAAVTTANNLLLVVLVGNENSPFLGSLLSVLQLPILKLEVVSTLVPEVSLLILAV